MRHTLALYPITRSGGRAHKGWRLRICSHLNLVQWVDTIAKNRNGSHRLTNLSRAALEVSAKFSTEYSGDRYIEGLLYQDKTAGRDIKEIEMVGDNTCVGPIDRHLAFCILIFASGVFYAAFTPIVSGEIEPAPESHLYQSIWLILYCLLALCVAMRFDMIVSWIVDNILASLLMIVYLRQRPRTQASTARLFGLSCCF